MNQPDAGPGIAWVDRLNDRIGRAVSWLTLAMVLVTFVIVIMRYVFDIGFIWMQESITWMHALVFMLGAAWALRRGDHVRVDVFYKRLSSRQQGWIDLSGSLLWLLPFCIYIGYEAWPYVERSWLSKEGSREASGLPGVFLLKSVILLTVLLLALQGISESLRAWRRLKA